MSKKEMLPPDTLTGLQKYLQRLVVGCQKRSLVLPPGRIFAELRKPMGCLAAWREGGAVRVVIAYITWSLGVVVNMETAVCFFPGTWKAGWSDLW